MHMEPVIHRDVAHLRYHITMAKMRKKAMHLWYIPGIEQNAAVPAQTYAGPSPFQALPIQF